MAQERKGARVHQGPATGTHCSRIDGGKLIRQLHEAFALEQFVNTRAACEHKPLDQIRHC